MPRWFAYCLLAMLFWGGWAVIPNALKMHRKEMPISSFQQMAFSTIGFVPVMAVVFAWGRRRDAEPKPGGVLCAFVAGIIGGFGNIAYYAAAGAVGSKASVVAPLTALYPLLTVLLAMLFLGERPNRVQAAGIAIAAGSLYAFNPLGKEADLEALRSGSSALLPILFWGVTALLQKISADWISSRLATLWFLAASIPMAVFIVCTQPMQWELKPLEWLWVLLLGVLLGLGNFFFIAANANEGKASVVTPLSGLYSIVTLPLAYYFFDERLGKREWLGVAAALAAVVALSWERKPPVETAKPGMNGGNG